jgi:hypothetical protein
MVWWRRVQGVNRCSGAAVCQMRSQLSADVVRSRCLGVSSNREFLIINLKGWES